MVGLNFQVFFYLIQIIIMLLFFLKIGNILYKGADFLSILTEARQELIDYITQLPIDSLNTAIDKDSWTVLQVVEHLALMEEDVSTVLKDAILKREFIEEVRQKPIHLTTDRTQKFSAPDKWQPKQETYSLEEVLHHLEKSRESLNNAFAHANDADLEHVVAKNDAFGALSLAQWPDFIGYHEQRHLAQIKEIIAAIS